MKGLKVLRIVGIIGYVALVIGVGMDLANLISDKDIFSATVTLPFYIAALIGLICDYVRTNKEKKANKSK